MFITLSKTIPDKHQVLTLLDPALTRLYNYNMTLSVDKSNRCMLFYKRPHLNSQFVY